MKIYAHRGTSGTHPENTLAAFREAARLPIHGVEFDVHLTADHELVVIHDEQIDRTSNGSGYIKDMTLAELRKFDFGYWFSEAFEGEFIPTLPEVLAVFSKTDHHINIELKSDIFPYEGMNEKVVQLIKAMQLEERVVISSFDHETIRTVKQLAPEMETAALFMETLVDPLDYIQNIPADALHLFMPAAIRPFSRKIIEKNIPVRAFTVNEEKYVDILKSFGVTAIFTDFPERMMNHLHSKS